MIANDDPDLMQAVLVLALKDGLEAEPQELPPLLRSDQESPPIRPDDEVAQPDGPRRLTAGLACRVRSDPGGARDSNVPGLERRRRGALPRPSQTTS